MLKLSICFFYGASFVSGVYIWKLLKKSLIIQKAKGEDIKANMKYGRVLTVILISIISILIDSYLCDKESIFE